MTFEEVDFGLPPEELFAGVHDRRGSFFLDSGLSVGGLGAYSFIGFDPFLAFRARGREITLTHDDGRVETLHGDPLDELRQLFRRYRRPAVPPWPFGGGAVGYFSYELGARFERVGTSAPDELGLPDAEFGFYEGLLVFEKASRRTFIAANPVHDADAGTILRRMAQVFRDALNARRTPSATAAGGDRLLAVEPPRANVSKAEYVAAIARIKAYIAAGDVYQVNLTQRFAADLPCAPYTLYERLRRRSPAPFASYLNFGSLQVASSSPERFLSVRSGEVETRPIKGTRPRGATPEEDARLQAELLASEKDRAELLMIVDLERNDLGRVCKTGSIRVDEIFRLETHPTVHHLVATVSGRLRDDCDVFDCLRATFPGGSITGAPKIRAMQIIDELEPCRRYVYTGAIGYLGYDGNCDFNIAIRTLLCTGGRAYYHVGGGIVWDSDPEAEYQETLDKGRAMQAALTDPQ